MSLHPDQVAFTKFADIMKAQAGDLYDALGHVADLDDVDIDRQALVRTVDEMRDVIGSLGGSVGRTLGVIFR